MIDPSLPRVPAQPISWSEVSRLCRRICLLREQQQPEAAEELRHGELAAALVRVRPSVDSDAALEEKLAAIFATEAERVASAAVLAELLVPLLAEKNIARAPAEFPAAHPMPSASEAPMPRADPADIAHFIDEMIAQERKTARRVS